MYTVEPEHQKEPDGIPYSSDRTIADDQNATLKVEIIDQLMQQLESAKQALKISQQQMALLDQELVTAKLDLKTFHEDTLFFSSEGEQVFKTAFRNSIVGIAITDLKGDFKQVNEVYMEITGWSKDELIKKPHSLIIHPADQNSYHDAWKEFLQSESGSFKKEIRYYCKLHEIVWVRVAESIIKNKEGDPQCLMIVCVNISKEKLAQEKAEEITKRFRFLADSMPQQIWTADADGNLNYFSQAFYEYSGMTFNDIENSNWLNIVYPEDLEITNQIWKQSLDSGQEFIVEHRLKRRDGNYKWQLSRAMAQRDKNENILMWVGSTINIHNHKTIEEQLEKQVLERTHDLREANFNLKHSNHDLEQFAYIATHDLQEPLRKIRTYSSWMTKQFKNDLPEEAQDFMLKIENASERMVKLIDDLLNYSLLLRPQEIFEITDLNSVLDRVLEDFDLLIKEKDAVITRMELPLIKAVPVQMIQLFSNLLNNALKFTLNGRRPEISITSRIIPVEEILALHLDIDLTYIEIAVNDNGIGFEQGYAAKVFTIFQRLNNRNAFAGTGIGLALCHKIVLYHHGHIYAKAKESEGATFYVVLPIPPYDP